MTRVSFERTGGFAGLHLSTTVDSQALDEAEAAQLEHEIEAAGFFVLPSRIHSSGGGVDRFEYRITVEKQGREHAVEVGESALPDSLRPLIEHLERLLRTRR
jgi:hypothetical protein